ncbi:hypothetical protein J1N35_037701 [Gossypium stocksii]|uniref:CCHC-type domain-containing protein n=1 Tax=Gossypium stocksii TaxID=47602 RepID=A0A9D3UKK2_9ROSI|nr:hypothetical protein J1N35_037701 [Gossypium stocksii]
MVLPPRENILKISKIKATSQEICFMSLEQNFTILGEGHSIMRPPLFNGTNYLYWRTRMKLFIQANDYEVCRIITNRLSTPIKRVECVIVQKEKSEWDDKNIKKVQMQKLCRLYFVLLVQMNTIKTLCVTMQKKYVTKIKEAQKKVGVAFKSTTCKKDEDSSNNDDDEDMVMFAKKFKKFMKFNKGKRFPRRDIIKGEPKKKEKDQIICYECKKSGHIKFDCPQLKKKGALKQKKKAMMTTWSNINSSDSDDDNEVANLCLMDIEEPKEEDHYFKASNSKKTLWCHNSGCFRHMIGDKSHFMELMPKTEGEVTFGDNSIGVIEGHRVGNIFMVHFDDISSFNICFMARNENVC